MIYVYGSKLCRLYVDEGFGSCLGPMVWCTLIPLKEICEVPPHPPVTRRLQFGLKDELAEKAADKKKQRKRKANDKDGNKKKEGKGKAKSKKAQAQRSKKGSKHKGCKAKKNTKTKKASSPCRSRGLSKLRKAKTSPVVLSHTELSAKADFARPDAPEAELVEEPSSSHGPVCKVKHGRKRTNQSSASCTNKGKGSSGKAKQANRKTKSSATKSTAKKGSKAKETKLLALEALDSYRGKVEEALEECCATDCGHDSFDMTVPHPESFQITVYWTRNAVGVKVHNGLLAPDGKNKGKLSAKDAKAKRVSAKDPKSKKYKSKDFRQIAYFSAGGCVYINYAMAQVFVPLKRFVTDVHLYGAGPCAYILNICI